MSTVEQLTSAWVITDNGFTDYVCEDHARQYAQENGIPPIETHTGYSLTREGYGIVADIYPVQSWDGYETDYPVSCPCGQYLSGVALTPEGRDYMLENDFPAWLYVAHGAINIKNNERG